MDIDEIIQTTVQELGRILSASRCLIRLGADANHACPSPFEFDQPGIAPVGKNSPALLAGARERVLARQTLALDDTHARRIAGAAPSGHSRRCWPRPSWCATSCAGRADLSTNACARAAGCRMKSISSRRLPVKWAWPWKTPGCITKRAAQQGELAILHSAAIATADSTSLDEALHKVAQAVFDALGDVSVAVMLIKPDTDDLLIRAGLGYADDDLESIQVKVGQGVTGWVAQTGQPALVPDMRHRLPLCPFRRRHPIGIVRAAAHRGARGGRAQRRKPSTRRLHRA